MNNYIQRGVYNIVEKKLVDMRENFSKALSEKAVCKLDEKKKEIASNYFGQDKRK